MGNNFPSYKAANSCPPVVLTWARAILASCWSLTCLIRNVLSSPSSPLFALPKPFRISRWFVLDLSELCNIRVTMKVYWQLLYTNAQNNSYVLRLSALLCGDCFFYQYATTWWFKCQITRYLKWMYFKVNSWCNYSSL